MVVNKFLTNNLLRKSSFRAFSNINKTPQAQTFKEVNTQFVEPLEDFDFESQIFAQPAIKLTQSLIQSKEVLKKQNDDMIQVIAQHIKKDIDPFNLVEQDMKLTKEFAINNILKTEYKDIEAAALYNLNLKGKNFRSAILFIISRAIFNNLPEAKGKNFSDTKQYDQVKAVAAAIEIAHNSSLLQDDIIDKADSRRSKIAAHKLYGASNSVFASDFMIARASRMLIEMFDTTHISQLFSTVLYNLVYGELIQAKRDMKQGGQDEPFNIEEYFQSYISKTYYKTASMISLGCRAVGVIYSLDTEAQRNLFNFGANLGIAFQVHDDILDFTQNSEQLGKPAYNDIKEGIITAPLVYTLVELQQKGSPMAIDFEQMMKRKFEQEGDVKEAIRFLNETSGIEVADQLSIDYINLSIQNLEEATYQRGNDLCKVFNLKDDIYAQALKALALKVKTRKY